MVRICPLSLNSHPVTANNGPSRTPWGQSDTSRTRLLVLIQALTTTRPLQPNRLHPIEFVCCDNPHANRLTLHILAAVAEYEARRISERTKAALAAYKARGGKLGTPANLTREAGRSGSEATRAKARTAYAALLLQLRAWRASGLSYREIAGLLNGGGRTTRNGVAWNHNQVKRVLARIGD